MSLSPEAKRALQKLIEAAYQGDHPRFVRTWFVHDQEMFGAVSQIPQNGKPADCYGTAIEVLDQHGGPTVEQFIRCLEDVPGYALNILEVAESLLDRPEDRARLRERPEVLNARRRLQRDQDEPAVLAADLTLRIRGLRLRVALAIRGERLSLPRGFLQRVGFVADVVGPGESAEALTIAARIEQALGAVLSSEYLASVVEELEGAPRHERGALSGALAESLNALERAVPGASPKAEEIEALGRNLDDWLLLREVFVGALSRRAHGIVAELPSLAVARKGSYGPEELRIRLDNAWKSLLDRVVEERVYQPLRIRLLLAEELLGPLAGLAAAQERKLIDRERVEWETRAILQRIDELERSLRRIDELERSLQRIDELERTLRRLGELVARNTRLLKAGGIVSLATLALVVVAGVVLGGTLLGMHGRLGEQKTNLSNHMGAPQSLAHPLPVPTDER